MIGNLINNIFIIGGNVFHAKEIERCLKKRSYNSNVSTTTAAISHFSAKSIEIDLVL
ncbi:MAG TPA: hypothetical protein VHF08_07305 [Nitrososphaeraceae archaeon]|nr:hypothetical protein [Nitrososphaeraceae archaeon]